ncbi:AAC(3) family N-acetyltransferase [Anaerobaca lacustris]|uniref:Aminoglycoside N(3)-acetyltransferase n=1 Tax=Anaerobaca lacustris TaxID=3044600 RepID=A0AAW6U2T0_9BACT|nr:AAC(3) family N-acetyltransferase [Sedimentisphaerales bacterium M17dextr]
MWKNYLRQILPDKSVTRIRSAMAKRDRDRRRKIPFTEDDLLFALEHVCGVRKGDVLFVHSSIDGLAMDVPPRRILEMLIDAVGPEGTILMPSYPKLPSYMYFRSEQVWDVRRTPSYSGLITEIFRRMEGTRRSLHPTKSVAVRGRLRDEMIAEHHTNVRPYAATSPYFKFVENGGKAIGIGVSARYIAFIHTIDDYLAERFPMNVYAEKIASGRVIDYAGREITVSTLVHDFHVRYDPVGFLRRNVPKERADSVVYKGREFFYADARTVFETGVELAEKGVTVCSGPLRGFLRSVAEIRFVHRRSGARERRRQESAVCVPERKAHS